MASPRAYPPVTIGFVPKEKFHLGPKTLEAIFRCTDIPFNLIAIDCGIPRRHREAMDRVMAGKPGCRVVQVDRFLQPNESKALVCRESKDDYIALVENDTFVSPGWLSKLMDACLERGGDCVVMPELFEGPTKDHHIHMDPKLGSIRKWTQDGKVFREILPDLSFRTRYKDTSVRVLPTMETHCYLIPRKVIDRIGPPDGNISTREQFDISLALHEAGIPVVLHGGVRVNFYQAPPVFADELDFFKHVWDPKKSAESSAYLVRKWNLVGFPDPVQYALGQQYRTNGFSWFLYRIFRKVQKKFRRETDLSA